MAGEIQKLAESKLLMHDDLIVTFCMGNAITMEDTNGNRKLLKLRYDAKVDCVASAMDAWIAYKHNIESFG